MFGLESLADQWDQKHQQSKEILQDWVNSSESKPGLYRRAFSAALLETSMFLGAGLVDLIRIGEGVKKGGWGYGRDILRLLAFAGPMLRLGKYASAKWVFNPSGGVCASVATAKVLRQTGTRLFIRASDIVRQTGGRAPKNLNEFIPILRKLGARFKEYPLKNLSQLNQYLKGNPKSVIMFGIKWVRPNGKRVGHALYAFKDTFGNLRIADRTGKIVKSLEELERYYPGIRLAEPQGAAILVKNAIIVEGTSLLSMLSIEVNAIISTTKHGSALIINPSYQ